MYDMVVEECASTNTRPVTYDEFLAGTKLSTISKNTAWRCAHCCCRVGVQGTQDNVLVFKEHKIMYFNDRHENDDIRRVVWQFILHLCRGGSLVGGPLLALTVI